MIRIGSGPGDLASIPKRSAIAEAQASGEVLWEMKKTAARDAWKEIEPSIVHVASIVTSAGVRRPHATVPERWMLNFGARRLRASKLARQTTIPAFVDETADSYDQVIEKEQREV